MTQVMDTVKGALGLLMLAALFVLARTNIIPIEHRYPILIGILGMGILIFVMPSALANLRIRSGASTRRPQDVSDQLWLPKNETTRSIIAQLEQLGFTRIGETNTPLSGVDHAITWFFGNPNRTIIAEVVDIGDGMCQFSTVLGDLAIVETSYPLGEHINKPNYYSRKNKDSVSAAYKYHVQESKAVMEKHGKPRSLKTMAAILQWDKIYRERYVHYKMNTGRFSSALNLVAVTAIFVGLASIYFLFDF